jgi:transposase
MRLVQDHPEWALGFEDETWWSRFAQPQLHAWGERGQVVKLLEKTPHLDDPAPKALACYGLLVRSCPQVRSPSEQVWLRFADGNPNSLLTIDYLHWCCAKLQAEGKKALLLIWDNASWHVSQAVRNWLTAHNQQVKHSGQGVRLLVCPLPTKSPWLNPIEPMWVHGKRRVAAPEEVLSPTDLAERVCATFDQPYEPHLSVSKNVV